MGRELKRVAIDFDWPLEKRWSGYLNPHSKECRPCPDCQGNGETSAGQRLKDLVRLIMLSGSDAARGECHPWLNTASLLNTSGLVCAGFQEISIGLAGRSPSVFGHDCIDQWNAVDKVLQAAGLPKEWGYCSTCKGEGSLWSSPEAEATYDAWEPTEPPLGDGYQIWETVTEGSPISPVFATPEELADYMAGRPWGADHGSSREAWLRFIQGPGYAPTMVARGGELLTGPNAGDKP